MMFKAAFEMAAFELHPIFGDGYLPLV